MNYLYQAPIYCRSSNDSCNLLNRTSINSCLNWINLLWFVMIFYFNWPFKHIPFMNSSMNFIYTCESIQICLCLRDKVVILVMYMIEPINLWVQQNAILENMFSYVYVSLNIFLTWIDVISFHTNVMLPKLHRVPKLHLFIKSSSWNLYTCLLRDWKLCIFIIWQYARLST